MCQWILYTHKLTCDAARWTTGCSTPAPLTIGRVLPLAKNCRNSSFLKQTSFAHNVHLLRSCHGSVQKNDHGVNADNMPGSSNILRAHNNIWIWIHPWTKQKGDSMTGGLSNAEYGHHTAGRFVQVKKAWLQSRITITISPQEEATTRSGCFPAGSYRKTRHT